MIAHERLYYEYSAVSRKPCASLNSWRLVMNHNKFWFLLFWVYYVVNAMRNHQTSKLVPILRDTMIAKLTLSDLCHTAVYSIDCTYGN
jgi:hypothetical protein